MGCFGLGAIMLGVLAFGGTQDVSWVIVFSTLSYGLIGSIAAVVYLYTPEYLSDPDARDRNGCRYFMAPDRFGDRTGAHRLYAGQRRGRLGYS